MHIESRKSRKHVGDYEIYVDVECASDMIISDVIGGIKRRVLNVLLNDGQGHLAAMRKTVSLDRGDTMCEFRASRIMCRWFVVAIIPNLLLVQLL